MKSALTSAIISAAFLGLSACASTPKPEEVCTSNWISKRSDNAVSRIEKREKPALSKLAKAAADWAQGKKMGPFQMLALNSSVNKLTKELRDGQGLKDLKTLAKTCNDPKIVSDSLTKLMEDSGLSGQMVGFVEGLQKYQDLINIPTQSPNTPGS